MPSPKIKQTVLFLYTSFFLTPMEMGLVFLPFPIVFWLFSGHNELFWAVSFVLTFLTGAWIQGSRAGVTFDYNFFLSGFISCLFLNAYEIALISSNKFPGCPVLSDLLLPLILMNYVIAFYGCKYGHRFLREDSPEPPPKKDLKENLFYTLTTIPLLFFPFYLLGWLIIIPFVKYILRLPI